MFKTNERYKIYYGSDKECPVKCHYTYEVLVRPNGTTVTTLREPEDRSFCKNGNLPPILTELNLLKEILEIAVEGLQFYADYLENTTDDGLYVNGRGVPDYGDKAKHILRTIQQG